MAKRRIESLNLYEPLPLQKRFHDSAARERVVRGSNRSGKTLCAAIEVAKAVTGKSDLFPKTDGRFFCVGEDGKHIGQVMYRKLFRAGAFKIIRDLETGAWRSYRHWQDKDREEECKLAGPLIPPRLIKEIAWENKKENWPNIIRLVNGWELSFFSSLGDPPQGSDVDGVWFDEEVVNQEFYPELSARLLDRGGRFIWSATPQAGTEQLYDLHEKARDGVGGIEEFVLLLDDNPHIDNQIKREFASKLSAEAYQVRYEGDFAFLSFKVFPEYERNRDYFEQEWMEIPANWTRYAIIDPGRQICAVLFAAVPPTDVGDFVYLYDELYIPNCTAAIFGEQMRQKCMGQNFHAFIIDHQGSRVTDAGQGRSIESQYSEALVLHKVTCETTGSAFTWGIPDPKAGVEAVRDWLRIRDSGSTKLRYFRDKVPNFIEEIKRYRYKRERDRVTDDPEPKGRVHLMACLRYLALYRPSYHKPSVKSGFFGAAIQAFRKKMERKKNRQGPSVINLGPKEHVA